MIHPRHTFRFSLVGTLLCAQVTAQVTQRVSVATGGEQANDYSEYASISADGRSVAFYSYASNLVPGDTNGTADVFVHDRQTATTERVSVGSGDREANDSSFVSSLSADGRFVAFRSRASNLVQADANGMDDVFVRDRQLHTTERVSVDSDEAEGNQVSDYPSISSDGRYVAFESYSSNLVPGDTNGDRDIFVRDRQLGTTERVSVDSNGTPGVNSSGHPTISFDGRYVTFFSYADNLVPEDTNQEADIFIHDRLLATTERVSVSSSGVQGNNDSGERYVYACPTSVSDDGRYVAFYSRASNLVAGDMNFSEDIFVRDRQFATTERVSIRSDGGQATDDSWGVSLSSDGRYVTFYSNAGNLVPNDTNGVWDVFVRDRQLATTERISISSVGMQGDGYNPSISADGRYVAFHGFEAGLVSDDTNGTTDIFVRDRHASGFTSLCDPGLTGVMPCPCSNPPSGLGLGCDNSSLTGGAELVASGIAYLSMDSLVFTTSAESPTALSIVMQGNGVITNGVAYGEGVRCLGGTIIRRMYTKTASGGSITAPNFGAGDSTVSALSAAKGDMIQPGQSRWYLVYYRDPVVLGGCPSTSTFNATQTGEVIWSR